jgi:cell division topological specificity factor
MLKEMLEFWTKFEFIQKIFHKEEQTGKLASDRLRLVLIHDRSNFSPLLMESLRGDLIKIISRYMDIDIDNMEMGLDQKDGTMALAANIPIIKIKKTFSVASLDEESEERKPPEKQPAMPPHPKHPSPPRTKPRSRSKSTPVKRHKTRRK